MPASADPVIRNNVHVSGDPGGRPILFSHGFGGNQESWRYVAPAFESDFRVVLFDHVGAPGSDIVAYDRVKYDSLHGYADDVVELIETMGLTDVVFVGHSVSGMIGLLAANQRPDLFGHLVLVGPSPRYLDADGYAGGFSREAIDELLASMDSNFASWSEDLAPVLMGAGAGDELTHGLAAGIRRIDPRIAAQFARVTFLSDNRRDLADVTVPTLILQSAEDNIAGPEVGRFVHEHITGSRLVVTPSRGHIPHLSDPDQVISQIRAYLA
ncbi:alpha/beta fold hydrolase [Pseudolysinimonas sp.]|uniref:alpha/beta fold hydrolase n=1 Tax=Pseudolysinimonas sp. TaxID=2680009 RepID=UPI003F8105EA